MPPTTPEAAPGFWRCKICGTPNPVASYLKNCLGCGKPIPPLDLVRPAPTPPVVTPPSRITGWRRIELMAVYYAALVVVACAVIRWASLTWWVVPSVLFLPRWLFLAPVGLLAVGLFRVRTRRFASLLAFDAFLVVGPLMGFCLPVGRLWTSDPTGPIVRVMTFNCGGARLDTHRFLRYLERYQIDVVCFQEPGTNPEIDAYFANGWHLDSKRRIASRFPIVAEYPMPPDVNKSDERFTMRFHRVRILHPGRFEFVVGSAHLPTPRRGYQRFREKNLEGLRQQLEWWDEEAGRFAGVLAETGDLPTLVGGDFNMPSEYSGMAAIEATHPSAFDEAGWGYGYTRPSQNSWVRIDHVLGNRDWTFTRSWVGPDLGSDHLPLLAEAVLRVGK